MGCWTRRWTALFSLAGLLSVARCGCEEADLGGLPEPQIDVIDVASEARWSKVEDQDKAFVIDFGAQDIDGETIRTLRIRNVGRAQLKVSSIRLVEEGLDAEACPGLHRGFGFVAQSERTTPLAVDPNQDHDVRIRFAPTAAGPHCMGLLIESNAANTDGLLVHLSGQGSGGRLCTAPYGITSVDFGAVYVGDTATETAAFENCGNQPVTVSAIGIVETANPDGVFALGALPALPLELAAGQGFSLELQFTPADVRVYRGTLAGMVRLATADPYAGEQFLTLEGNGAERPRCKLAAIPATVNFGAVAGDAGGLNRELLLKNNGECHCEVTALSAVTMDVQAPGAEAGVFSLFNPPAVPFYLKGSDPAAEGCQSAASPESATITLTARYELPNRTDAFVERGHFDISSNDPVQSPLTVYLEANGGGAPRCQIRLEPEAPDQVDISGGGIDLMSKSTLGRWGLVRFGNVTQHFERQQPITLENIGNTNCTISRIEWRQPWTPDNEFGFANEARQPMSLPADVNIILAPGQIATFYATFAPTRFPETEMFPDMRCPSGYCGHLTNSMYRETCLNEPCRWGNGVDIYTDDMVTELDTLQMGQLGVFSVGFMGKPVQPAIDVIPGEIDYGLITVGCGSEERTIKVYNTGSGELIVTRLEITPVANPDEFRITAALVPPQHTVAPGGAPMPINVRFFPRRQGLHRADLIIYGLEGTNEMPLFTVPLQGEGTLETHATDVYRQLTEPLVDVLWVVDDSGSMSGEQQILADNFNAFFSQTSINNVDYHIAVTTTLTRDGCVPDFSNPEDTCSDIPPHEKAGVYTACQGNDKWLTPDTGTDAQIEAQFECNVHVSEGGNVNPDRPTSDSAEGGLLAAKLFLSPPRRDDPSFNQGFLRDDAKLYVIAVSDEEDQSDGPTDLYVDFFRNIKGFRNTDLVNFSAIAGDVPGGCTFGDDGAEAGARYEDVTTAMGGLFQSICAPDWSETMRNLAFDSFGLKRQFFLSRGAASERDIEVCVASSDLTGVTGACPGTVVPLQAEGAASGWFYDAGSNSVVFNQGSIPARGQWVRIDYDTACLPLEP